MPGIDGTGPRGRGPLSGRGLGKCVGTMSTGGKIKFMSIAIPVVAALVDDARRPDSITRRLFRTIKAGIAGTSQKLLSSKNKTT